MIGLTQQVDLDGKVVAARYLNRIKLITVRQTQQENGFSMRLDIGINLVRPHPGACTYPCAEVLEQRREWTYRTARHQRYATSATLVMTASTSEQRSALLRERLAKQVAPQMEFGRQILAAFAEAIAVPHPGPAADAAVAWTDGRQIHLAFCGPQRVVMMSQGHTKRLPPNEDKKPRWFPLPMEPGDWFIMDVPATDAALPLGSILRRTPQGLDAMSVCCTATAQVAQADPFNHHVVLAAHLLPT